ncbi:serine/threonine protein kinase [Nocardia otitidiscaviarum]|uniref:serine/threonine-protein kinase n=1 Tax=Nocardia otitidiscaviarum TaxID=1823 RepID=UPI0004A775B9|nr:serine/threonine-protein kinase [Nocardia otitidiscaviarum]MBF6132465.1 serine/threonine protein kinase [Nocardia otitidiscaviarum]MBF6488843.1 serine/threonine protein kinase [Nocardia otitidiscaviarum]
MSDRLTPGTIFAGYRIERQLGAGGMGTVYLARHPRLPRTDALKVLPEALSADPEFRARFLREADVAARLDHANIVAVHDRGIERGSLWISMQFVAGMDAAELLRRHPTGVPPQSALFILGEAAQGLDEAHRIGMLHRDVKPANILLGPISDGPGRVLVADFGIAKAAGESTALTQTGAVLATLAYAAPEQITAGLVDHRADVYALGCTFFELLTGRKPFPRATTAAVMRAHIQDPPPRASEMNPELPHAIDTVIARAMAKQPGDRYDSCTAFAAAAAAGLAGTPEPASIAPRPETRTAHTAGARSPNGRRRTRAAGFGALAAVSTLVVAGAVVWKENSAEPSSAARTSPTVSATGSSSPTATGGPATWGNYGFIANAFPGLVPATPITSGYQGVLCHAFDDEGNEVDVNAQLTRTVEMYCQGNNDPVRNLTVRCNSNRTPMYIRSWAEGVYILGDERWQRSSGTGRVVWGTGKGELIADGVLQVEFDDPHRNFCELMLFGATGTTGTDVYQRWWRDAPI